MSTLTLGDWLAASFALALGGGLCFALFFTVFWLLGMPGPKLWFGSGNIPADILEVSITAAIATFFVNAIGSFATLGYFSIVRKLRR